MMEQMRIKVDIATLEVRADTAEQKIQAVKNRFDRVGRIVAASGSYWEGDANDAHRREYQEYQDEIQEALLRFQENVTDLRKIAGIYQETVMDTEKVIQDLPADVII